MISQAPEPAALRTYHWGEAERSQLLRQTEPFGRLSPETVQHVARLLRPRRVERGEFVYLEGQSADRLNLLARGRVKILRETETGGQVILRLINAGELFGVSGGWGEDVYPASARALDESVVLRMPASDFDSLIRTHPDLALSIISGLGARLREAEERILALQTERVEQRIARSLLQVAAGMDNLREERLFAVPLSRQDLADLTGTTLSTASRTLSAWHRKGIVYAGRERVLIRRPDVLTRIAEGASE